MGRNPAMKCVFVTVSCVGIVVLAAAAEPPAGNQPKGTVRGVVAGEDGKPVAGARVWAYRLSHYEPIDPVRPAVDVTTDAEGRFRVDLAPGEYTASAAKGALVADERVWRGRYWEVEASKPVEVHIRLTNARRVEGTVVRKDGGKPVGSAMIVLGNGSTTTTDAEGRFAIQAATGRRAGLRAIAAGLADTDVALPPQGKVELRIEMARGFTVQGRVTDEAGRPVAGARVARPGDYGMVHTRMRSCLTDAEGKYTLPGFTPQPRPPIVVALHRDFAMAATPIEPPKDGDVLTLDLKLSKGFAIEGEVRGPDGKPIQGAAITRFASVELMVDPRHTVRTDRNGFFRLDRLATDAQKPVTVKATGFAQTSRSARPGRGDAVPKLSFTLAKGRTASGRVVDRKGQAVAGAHVLALLPEPGC